MITPTVKPTAKSRAAWRKTSIGQKLWLTIGVVSIFGLNVAHGVNNGRIVHCLVGTPRDVGGSLGDFHGRGIGVNVQPQGQFIGRPLNHLPGMPRGNDVAKPVGRCRDVPVVVLAVLAPRQRTGQQQLCDVGGGWRVARGANTVHGGQCVDASLCDVDGIG